MPGPARLNMSRQADWSPGQFLHYLSLCRSNGMQRCECPAQQEKPFLLKNLSSLIIFAPSEEPSNTAFRRCTYVRPNY